MHQLIAPTFNFLVLIAILAYYLKQPIKDFVSNRHVSMRDELARVRELLKQAQSKNEEFVSKLKAIDAEVASLRQQMAQDAKSAKQRLVSDAQRLSATIVSDARMAAEGLYSDLRGQLHSELGSRILERAETLLRDRLTGDDRARIRKEFSSQVEGVR